MVLNLNWEIIWVFVNLLILFLLMKKFLFGPITKLLDERAKGVADTLDQAETQLAEAERQKAEYTQQLASARGEAAHIVEEARKRADLAYSRRMDEAAQDVQRLNEQAARQRAADREAMLASAQKQVADFLSIKQNTYSQYENGVRQLPIDLLIRLSRYYTVSTDYILELTNVPEPYPQKAKRP